MFKIYGIFIIICIASTCYSYDFSSWTDESDTGTVTPNSPSSEEITMISGNGGSGGSALFCFTALNDLTLSFSWTYSTLDEGPSYDIFGYKIDGVFTAVADSGGSNSQTGTSSLSILKNKKFCFDQQTEDGLFGSATTIINLSSIIIAPPAEANFFVFDLISIENNCGSLHGRSIQCVKFITQKLEAAPLSAPASSLLVKYYNTNNDAEGISNPIYLVNGNPTKMKYKAFIPNRINDDFSDLDSKLPYLAYSNSDWSFNSETGVGNNIKRYYLAIFRSDQDLKDFIFENNFIHSAPFNYIYKLIGKAVTTIS